MAPADTPNPETGTVADANIRTVARIKEAAAERRTIAQRVSDGVSSFASRESAVAWHVAWFVIWIVLNLRVFPIEPFDPFPFSLLSIVVGMEAIILALFVLASQKRFTREEEHRAHLDLQVNLLAEQEMTLVMQMLKELCEHHGLRDTIRSKAFRELAKSTDVGQLAEDLERHLGEDETTTTGETRT